MRQGFTLLEMIITIAVLAILIVVLVSLVNPGEIFARRRDAVRIADLAALQVAIESYTVDNSNLPGCSTGCGLYNRDSSNVDPWIPSLSPYLGSLPVDPVNTAIPPDFLLYFYCAQDGVGLDFGYELMAILEAKSNESLMKNDGGSSDEGYEIGTLKTCI